jgi:hypothetical protein
MGYDNKKTAELICGLIVQGNGSESYETVFFRQQAAIAVT